MGEIMYHRIESDCTIAIISGASQMQQFVNNGFFMIYCDSKMQHFQKNMRHQSIRKGSNHFGKKVKNKSHFERSGEALGGSRAAPGRPRGGSGRLRGGSREVLGRSGRPDAGPELSKEAQGGSREAVGKRLGGVLGGQEAMLQAFWGHLGSI